MHKLLFVFCILFGAQNNLGITSYDKIAGSLLGAALGDALGAPVEFIKSYAQIKNIFPPNGIQGIDSLTSKHFAPDEHGTIVLPYTDDTAMSIVVVKTFLKKYKNSIHEAMGALAKDFVHDMEHPFGWARPSRAPGLASQKNTKIIKQRWLDGADRKDPHNWWKAGGIKDGGCGSVMHAHPFGLIFAHDIQKAELWAVEHSKITHGAPIALAACAAMAVGVAYAFNGLNPSGVVHAMYDAANRYDASTAIKIEKAIAYAQDISYSSEKVFEEFLGWSASDAIAATVYIFMKYPDDLQKAILLGVNTPGDSDSIASMAGALVGARLGIQQLPSEWIEQLEEKEKLNSLAHELAKLI